LRLGLLERERESERGLRLGLLERKRERERKSERRLGLLEGGIIFSIYSAFFEPVRFGPG
jgi:hypothetical protein